jgi:hypothetical protein
LPTLEKSFVGDSCAIETGAYTPRAKNIKSLEWLGPETCFRKSENEKIKATDLNILYKIAEIIFLYGCQH